MKQLWDDILAASENSKACLVTVIATEGTAPRKEGSKMLIIGGESLKGAVTIGGCIDAQVIAAADEVTRTGEPLLLREELGEEDAFEIGLTCAGALRVLIEPVKLDREMSFQVRQALKDGTPFALVTVAGSSLSSIKPASKIMVTPAKKVYGSLGDDRLNSMAANIAEDLLSKALSRTVAIDKSFQPLDEPQQAALEIFVEAIGINPDLFIFGAVKWALRERSLRARRDFAFTLLIRDRGSPIGNAFPPLAKFSSAFPGRSPASTLSTNSVLLCSSATRPNMICRFLTFCSVPMLSTSEFWVVLDGRPL